MCWDHLIEAEQPVTSQSLPHAVLRQPVSTLSPPSEEVPELVSVEASS